MKTPLILGLAVLGALTLTACSNAPTDTPPAFNDLNQNGKLDTYEDEQAPLNDRVADILSRLSLEQKVKMVTGTGFSVGSLSGSEKVPGAAGSTYAIPELGIPAMVLADGPAGLRIQPERKGETQRYYATAFPIATLLASTWDTALVNEVGQAMGNEVKEYGVDLFLAPGMNIHYNPLAGRNYEYYSEDPFLSGHVAAAIVNGVESHGVGTTIKHFVANNAETNRMWLNANMSERAAREIYLRGFEIAVKEAQPWAIMTSYNLLNGEHASESKTLLTSILRDEWGYEGLVMTDWFAGYDTAKQLLAGNDLIMPGVPKQQAEIEQALKSGELSEADLNKNVSRILRAVVQSPAFNDYHYSDKPRLKANASTARRAASEGVVLLKNQGRTLPLSSKQQLAVFGNTSYELISGGTGSGDVNEAYTVSLVEGLENNNLAINGVLKTEYERFMLAEKAKLPEKKHIFDVLPPIPEFQPSSDLLDKMVAETDVALITIGRNSGEFFDRKLVDFSLSDAEQTLINRVSEAYHQQGKHVVVILNIGNVIETVSWRDKADAILLPWQGGQEAGNAVADVLSGKVNPSGKLPTSFPMQYSDVPSAERFPGYATSDEEVTDRYSGFFKGQWSQLDYEEGIYMGYRYYDEFDVATAYEFGYGLSYTEFELSDLQIKAGSDAGHFSLSVMVKNRGDLAGKNVVQLYVSAPEIKLHKPMKELKGFVKTRLLQPGESERVTFSISPSQLASFDTQQRAWVAEAGDYTLHIGQSSKQLPLASKVSLAQGIVAEEAKVKLQTQQPMSELTGKK